MKVNILGFGVMAKQIASLFWLSGCEVYIWNHSEIDISLLEKQVRRDKKFLPSPLEGKFFNLASLNDIEDHLTIEAVTENIEVKKNLYHKLKSKINKTYFTSSSSYSPNEISTEVNTLHFFNPISHVKLVELYVSPALNDTHDIDNLLLLLKNQGYDVIRVNNNRGYLGNCILFSEISTIFKMIEKYKYKYSDINTLYTHLNSGRDVFSIIDIIGIDVTYQILKNLNEIDETIYVPEMLKQALVNNILGKKNKTSIKALLV